MTRKIWSLSISINILRLCYACRTQNQFLLMIFQWPYVFCVYLNILNLTLIHIYIYVGITIWCNATMGVMLIFGPSHFPRHRHKKKIEKVVGCFLSETSHICSLYGFFCLEGQNVYLFVSQNIMCASQILSMVGCF